MVLVSGHNKKNTRTKDHTAIFYWICHTCKTVRDPLGYRIVIR